MRRFLRDNSLSIMAFGLFGLFLVGQAVAGHEVYQRDLEAHGQPAIDFATYLLSGHFIEATFENWESEFLQMGALVLLSVYLYQKGSPESKDPDADEEVDRHADPSRPGAPWAVRSNRIVRTVYENSLGLALLGLFALSLVLHVLGGVAEYNREQEAHGERGHLGVRVRRYAGVLVPVDAELAERVPVRGRARGARDLPAPARLARVQAGGRARLHDGRGLIDASGLLARDGPR